MKSNPVNWSEIYVQDMARARKFHESVLLTKLHPMETDLEMCGFPGGLGAQAVRPRKLSPAREGNRSI